LGKNRGFPAHIEVILNCENIIVDIVDNSVDKLMNVSTSRFIQNIDNVLLNKPLFLEDYVIIRKSKEFNI